MLCHVCGAKKDRVVYEHHRKRCPNYCEENKYFLYYEGGKLNLFRWKKPEHYQGFLRAKRRIEAKLYTAVKD